NWGPIRSPFAICARRAKISLSDNVELTPFTPITPSPFVVLRSHTPCPSPEITVDNVALPWGKKKFRRAGFGIDQRDGSTGPENCDLVLLSSRDRSPLENPSARRGLVQDSAICRCDKRRGRRACRLFQGHGCLR